MRGLPLTVAALITFVLPGIAGSGAVEPAPLAFNAHLPLIAADSAHPPGHVSLVQIVAEDFSPYLLTVPPGDTVRWVNTGTQAHNVSSVYGLFRSEILSVGQRFEYRFLHAGVYDYRCSIHPSMTGSIIVE